MNQLRDGLASRLILVGIEGADAPTRARLSRAMAGRLRTNTAFVTVNNGEPVYAERDRDFLFTNRYLLSPAVTPQRFTPDTWARPVVPSTAWPPLQGCWQSRCCHAIQAAKCCSCSTSWPAAASPH